MSSKWQLLKKRQKRRRFLFVMASKCYLWFLLQHPSIIFDRFCYKRKPWTATLLYIIYANLCLIKWKIYLNVNDIINIAYVYIKLTFMYELDSWTSPLCAQSIHVHIKKWSSITSQLISLDQHNKSPYYSIASLYVIKIFYN